MRYNPNLKPPYGSIPDYQHPLVPNAGWWMLNEPGGNIAYDLSRNGNNGTLTNGPTWQDGALSFTATNHYVNIATFKGLPPTQISVSVWVKFRSYLGTYNNIIKHDWTSNNGEWILYAKNTGQLQWVVYNAGSISSIGNIQVNTWYHAVGIYDGAAVRLYVNGNPAAPAYTSVALDTTGSVTIGSTSSSIDALVDDVRIYNRGLSAAEVGWLYENTLGEYAEFPKLDLTKYFIPTGAVEYPYTGALTASLTPGSVTLLGAVYTGSESISITPAALSTIETVHTGSVDASITPVSTCVGEFVYTGSVGLSVSPESATLVEAAYTGAIEASVTPSHSALLDIVYTGAGSVSLTPSYSVITEKLYTGDVAAAITPAALSVIEEVYLGDLDCSLTLASSYNMEIGGYIGGISIAVTPAALSVIEAVYAGGISITATPSAALALSKVYTGDITAAITPGSASLLGAVYTGAASISLAPGALSAIEAVYAGSAPIAVTPAGLTVIEEVYTGTGVVTLTPASSYSMEAAGEYTGDISIALSPSFAVVFDKLYTGSVSAAIAPGASSVVELVYAGALPVAVAPGALSVIEEVYAGSVALAISNAAQYTIEAVYAGSVPVAITPSVAVIIDKLYTGSAQVLIIPNAATTWAAGVRVYTGALSLSFLPDAITSWMAGVRVYTGSIPISMSVSSECYIDLIYTGDCLIVITVRAILPTTIEPISVTISEYVEISVTIYEYDDIGVIVMDEPVELEKWIRRGDTDKYLFALTQVNGNPVDLTDADIKYTAKKDLAEDDDEAAVQLASTDVNEIQITDPTGGEFMIYLAAENTDQVPGDYTFDVQLKRTVSGRPDVKTIAFGILSILPDVTRDVEP